MPLRCVAVGCKNSRRTGHKMHTFPRDPKRRLEWAVKVNLAGENGKLWVPPKDCNYGVCEAHFDEDQYEPRRQDRKLKPFAVPTLFAHRKQPKKRKPPKRAELPNPISQKQNLFDATSNDHTYLAPKQSSKASSTSAASTGIVFKTVQTPPVEPTKENDDSLLADDGNTATLMKPSTPSSPAEIHNDSVEPVINTNGVSKQPTILMGPAGTILVPCSDPGPLPGAGSFVLVGSTLIPMTGQKVAPESPAALQVPLPPSSPQVPLISSVQSLSTGLSEGYLPLTGKPLSYDELVRENQRLQDQLISTKQVLSDSVKQMSKVRTSLAKQTERLFGFLNADQVDAIVGVGESIPWKEETLKYCVELYSASAEVYRKLLDRKYPFPPVSALKGYCKKSCITEGVPAELLANSESEDVSELNVVWL